MPIIHLERDQCTPRSPRPEFVLAVCLTGIAVLVGCRNPMQSQPRGAGGKSSDDAGGSMSSGGAGGTGGRGSAQDAKSTADASSCDDLAEAALTKLDGYLDSISAQTCQTDSDCGMLSLDASTPGACVPPVAGAPCTAEQRACATCCTDIWSCANGVWQSQFIGCLPTTFTCGGQTCQQGQAYCDVTWRGGEFPEPLLYACLRLPASCYGQRCPSCDCLTQAGISFDGCSDGPSGAVTVNHR